MTITDFNKTAFAYGTRIIYNGKEYPVVSVDFVEALIAIIKDTDADEPELSWVRCENCQII